MRYGGIVAIALATAVPVAAEEEGELPTPLDLEEETAAIILAETELDAAAEAELAAPVNLAHAGSAVRIERGRGRVMVGPQFSGGEARYAVRTESESGAASVRFSTTRPITLPSGALLPAGLPVSGRISSNYGYRKDPINGRTRRHSGVDFAVPHGTPVIATSDGVVGSAGWAGGYGIMVSLEHGGGVSSRYAHLSRLAIRPGQRVRQGQVLGYAGSTGRSTGSHVHYEVRVDGRAVDPLGF